MKLLQPSMMCCFFTLMVKHYTGHRVIYMIQFDITNNINNRLLKGGTYRTIVVLDHKQKCVLEWMFLRVRWNILARSACVSLVQFSYSGRKSEMDFSNRGLTNILLTMLSKDTLYRIIFKLVLLFHKYCISWSKWNQTRKKIHPER